ncbi:hypothetical protein HPP92_024819 [Vanilla planifolia]|uniref:Uncharacterized protein n=1 Tax=Vanilla planifolia TaxID=51239 RepID=A0A835UBI6_VANPL|nr:hypothetical protein HPP92_024819 [Vanilla planifolia]
MDPSWAQDNTSTDHSNLPHEWLESTHTIIKHLRPVTSIAMMRIAFRIMSPLLPRLAFARPLFMKAALIIIKAQQIHQILLHTLIVDQSWSLVKEIFDGFGLSWGRESLSCSRTRKKRSIQHGGSATQQWDTVLRDSVPHEDRKIDDAFHHPFVK